MRRSWRYGEIERLTWKRIQEYSQRFSAAAAPPVPIDMIIERLFGLTFVWEEIPEDGKPVFAALRPGSQEIVLNEKWGDLFHTKQGLERFTKGHELGHWELHVDHGALNQGRLFEALPESVFLRREAERGTVWIARSAFLNGSPDSNRGDTLPMKREVDRYAGSLLIPRDWLIGAVRHCGALTRRTVTELTDAFDVSFSAMRVRLNELKIGYVTDDGSVYRSRAQAGGQLELLP